VLGRAPVVPGRAPLVPRRAPWVLGRATDASEPLGLADLPSEEGWLSSPGGLLRTILPRRGGLGGAWVDAAGRAVPPKRKWQDLRSVGSAPPRGFGASEAPVVGVLSGASPGRFVFRRASPFRGKASVCIAVIPLAGSDLLAAAPKHGCHGPASAPRAPKRRWCVCESRVGSASAEAPLVRLRGAPPRTARACRGMLGRSLRHVSLVRWARRPSGSLRCAEAPRGAGTFPGHRSAPGFLGPPKRFREGAFLVAQERGAAEGVAPKRAVFPLPWRAEARAGRPHRPQADERDELLSRPWGEPRGGGEDELSGSRNAPGRRLRFGESRNQT